MFEQGGQNLEDANIRIIALRKIVIIFLQSTYQ